MGDKMISTKDLMILANLRKNSRESLTRLSRKTRIPVSTLYDKLKSYSNGIITKHTAIIDFTKLGFHTRANILVKISREQREGAKAFLVNNHNVNSVYKISNGYDYLIEAVFRNVKDIEDFLEQFETKFQIEEKQVYYVIEDIKKEAFMENDELVGILGV